MLWGVVKFFLKVKFKLVSLNSFDVCFTFFGASLVTQMVKNLSAMWETQVQSLG